MLVQPDVLWPTDKQADRFGHDLIRALNEFLTFAETHGFTKRAQVLSALASHKDVPLVLEHLRARDATWDDFEPRAGWTFRGLAGPPHARACFSSPNGQCTTRVANQCFALLALTDAQWEIFEPPPPPAARPHRRLLTGRPPSSTAMIATTEARQRIE